MTIGEARRADFDGVVPAMPGFGREELRGLPAKVGLLGIAEGICAIAEELGVPFGVAEFPGDGGAAELPVAVEPAAIHRPVPGKRCAVLAEEERLDASRCPMAEPIRQLLDGGEVWIEVD